MATRRQKFWTGAASVALLSALIGWQLYALLPGWVGRSIRTQLEKAGLVGSQFRVEQVSPVFTAIGPGSILLDANALAWQQVRVEYTPLSLLRGRVEDIQMVHPHLSLNVLAPVAAVGAAGTSTSGEGSGLRDQLLNLPLQRFEALSGRLTFDLEDAAVLDTNLDAKLERQPYGTSGEVSLAGPRLVAHVSLRVPKADEVVTVQANSIFPTNALVHLESDLASHLPTLECAPQLLHSGQLFLDVLAEIRAQGGGRASFQASLEDAIIRIPDLPADFAVYNAVVGGTLNASHIFVAGGLEWISPDTELFGADPFKVNFRYDPVEGAHFESEAFDWRVSGVSGRGAFRGRFLPPRLDQAAVGSLEWSMSRLSTSAFQAGAFSLLLGWDGLRAEFSASPVGLEKSGTLWLENLKGSFFPDEKAGLLDFEWFNTAGLPMGKVAVAGRKTGDGRIDFSITASDQARFKVEGSHLGNVASSLQVAGEVQAGWINSLIQWMGGPSVSLSGPPVGLQLDVQGPFPFLWGSGSLQMNGVGLSFPDGLQLKGIEGRADFLVNLLPRTETSQPLSIARLEHADMLLTDIRIEWALPSIQSLQVRSLTARMEGARIRMDPFELDPRDPLLRAKLHFENLPASKLMEWLKEERFALQGAVSGSLVVGWEKGTLTLGEGRLRLDNGSLPGRFLFVDETFLRQRFASFSGVPADLRDRFLEALLTDGIRIDSLEAELGPAAEPGKVLMRIAIKGESRTDKLQVPIEGFVINNLISLDDLAELLGLFAPVRFLSGAALP